RYRFDSELWRRGWMMQIEGKTALVTGASGGMGAAIAVSLAKAGAQVLLLARREDELNKVAAEIRSAGGKAMVYPIDLTDSPAVEALAGRISREVGTPDIVVNNAGAGQWKFIEETSAEEARQMITMPYLAAFCVTRAFIPEMLKRNSGHIVNISSVASRFVWPGATAYTAARWAMRGFTEALRSDLYGTGIGVTLYESAQVASPYWERNPGSRERIPKIGGLLLRTLTPEEVGAAIVDGIRRNQRLIVIPFMLKIIYLQHFFLPWVVQWLMNVTGYRRPQR
ncbi:MAG: SDR family NAD(P)-dependent oxidoreductase, partial [Chromatiales bacterium]